MTRITEELAGRTLGSVGLGCIGTIVAGCGWVSGTELIAWGPTLDAARAAQSNGECVAFDELFARSDALSFHALLTDQRRGLMVARELKLMQRSIVLVNTARGAIVDQDALVTVCKDGAIAGAVLENVRARMAIIPTNVIYEVVLDRHHT